jgi:hypothetical protein
MTIHINCQDNQETEEESLEGLKIGAEGISSLAEQLKAYTDSMAYKINIIIS